MAGYYDSLSDDLAECSTLFINNIGRDCTVDELKQILSEYPGFNTVKIYTGSEYTGGGKPFAFADFKEIDQATLAMEDLDGFILPSSEVGGIRVNYARSKMRPSARSTRVLTRSQIMSFNTNTGGKR